MSDATGDGGQLRGAVIEDYLAELRTFPPPEEFARSAVVRDRTMYERAAADPAEFWAEQARALTWFEPWEQVLDWQLPFAKWFVGGRLNIAFNCLDRHVEAGIGDRVAFLFEGEPGDRRTITYAELLDEVGRCANAMRALGIERGDRVAIYMPMIPELPVAMLACARIGAAHSVVFGGFSAEALRDRIEDASARLLITADGGWRRGQAVELKPNADHALSKGAQSIEGVLVVRRLGDAARNLVMQAGRDHWWHELVSSQDPHSPAEAMDAEDLLFLLYTSGTTARPKGIMHTTGGYLTQVAFTHRTVFDLKPETDVYWCAADIGWVTGHSYIVYGPLANGATTVMFESTPLYPDPGRYWRIVDDLAVNVLYTAPTALRALAQAGDSWVKKYKRDSLRILGTVGEPINPETWRWYHDVCGDSRCAIVDTWWQTETGGVLITPLPGVTPTKPGSATLPFFGVKPVVMDITTSKPLEGNGVSGALCLASPWPGQARTVWGDHARFRQTYFSTYPGYYFTGDGVKRDEDGYYWITGRIDDVLNVSGHRIGTAEIESALVAHEAVAEAAVVGFPHDIKGTGIYCYVLINSDYQNGDHEQLVGALKQQVRNAIGAFAAPDIIHIASGLPKTRSGKIMRRILRKVASSEYEGLGDTSTLAEPDVVQRLIDEHKKAHV